MSTFPWQPENPAGHSRYCAHPSHPRSSPCQADPDDPPTLAGRPSLAWYYDHCGSPPPACPRCEGQREWDGRPAIATCYFCGMTERI